MELDVLKESNVEICENYYALSMNYLKMHDSVELTNLLFHVNKIENEIRICKNIDNLYKLIANLKPIIDRIEVIINE